MANAAARRCPRCHALVPLALQAAHDHQHRELDAAAHQDTHTARSPS